MPGGTSAALGGSFGGGATSAVWSDGGAGGSFTNNGGGTPNTATYTASASSGTPVTLTLTTSGGSCGLTSDSKTIVVNPNPTVNAGGAMAAICQGGTSAALGGSFGGGATSAVWSDGGAGGSFTNNGGGTPNTATYTASASSGTPVTLTLTTSGGSCGTVFTSKTIVVNPNPTVNAGGAMAAICQGGTSAALGGSFGGGATSAVWSAPSGTFTNNTGSTPGTATFTAAANSTSPITLTLTTSGGSCGTTFTSKTIVVNPNPTVNAGGAMAAICQGGTSVTLGGSFGGGATSAIWSDGGAGGSFTNNGGGTPNTATYTASASSGTPVTLTLTTSGGSCGTVFTSKTIVVNPNPTVNAGGAMAAICQGGTSAALGGSVGGGATGGTWSTPAGGTFNPGATNLNATWTPPGAYSGTATLTLTSSGGSCGTTFTSKTIVVNPGPTVNPGAAMAAICQGGTSAALGGSVGGGATGGTWSTPAGGTFNPNATTLNATWTPPGAFSGTATLTLTTSGGSCGTTSANKTILVNALPAATGVTICQGGAGSLTSAAACAAGIPGTAGPNYAGTGATSGGPDIAWSNPGNIVSNNNSYALANNLDNGDLSEGLIATNFGFAIPAGATITGVQVTIGRFGENTNTFTDNSVLLVVGGTTTGSNRALAGFWPTTETPANYGTASDLWGTTLTPAQVNANNFGASLVVQSSNGNNRDASVDYITITISYTTPGSLNWYTVSSGGSLIGNGSPFNPVGVAGSGLPNTNAAGTTTFYAECAAAPGCRTAANFVINPLPTISGNLNVCIGLTSALTGSGTPAASTPWVSATPAVATVNSSGVVTGVAAGTSVITYTNNNGCSITATVTVSAPAISGTLNVCIGFTRTLTGNGTPAASNPWVSSNTAVATVNSSGVVAGVAPGTTNITYTNNIGCFTTSPFTVNALPTVSITGSTAVCAGGPNSSTTLLPATGGVWASSNNSIATVTNAGVVTGVAAGAATFTFTQTSTGCSNATAAVTVNARPVATFTTSPGANVCANTNVTYTTQAGQSNYVWSVPGVAGTNYTIISGGISSTDNTVTLQWLTTGGKTVTVNYSNSNGCTSASSASNTTTVNARPSPTFTTFPVAAVCANASVTYTTQAGQSNYLWSVPGIAGTDYTITAGGIGAANNTVTLQWLTSGSKTVTVNYTNGSGCTALSPVSNTTTVNARPIANAITGPSAVCVGSTINLTPNATGVATLTYTWATSNAGLATVTNAGVVTGVAAGTPNITYTVTDGNTCTATSAAYPVTVNARPTITFTTAPGANVCASTNVTYTTQAGQSNYIWSVPGVAGTNYTIISGGIGSADNTVTLQWITAGSKTVTVNYTNSNGCTGAAAASNTTTVNARPTPTFTVEPGVSVCVSVGVNTTNVTYTTQAGQSNYTWSVPGVAGTDYTIIAGGIGTGSNTVTLQWLTTGSKTVTVNYTNASSCTGLTPVSNTATVIALPVVNTSAPSVCVNSTITATPNSGGTWVSSNNSIATITNAGLITGVSAGTVTFTYTLTATGCSKTTSSVTVNALPVVAPIGGGNSAICVNDITLFTNGTAGGTWSIINGTGTASVDASGLVTGLSAGTVTVVYTYSNGICINNVTAPLTINPIPVVAPISGGATSVCVNVTTPAFTNTTPGGTWSILNGTGSASVNASGVVTGLTAGNVLVVYTVDNGTCSTDEAISLTVNPLPAVAAIGGGALAVCVNSTTAAFTNATAGGVWSIIGGTGTANITVGGVVTGLSAGNVTVAYTVNNGTCSNVAIKSLTVNALPVIAAIGGGAATVCVNSTTPAFTNATAGGVWSILNGTGTASVNVGGIVTGLTAGTVTVVYTYSNGTCSDNVTVLLTVNALPVAGAITGINVVCAGSTINLNSNASGSGSLVYTWLSSNTSIATVSNTGVVTGVAAGATNITYTVDDGNSCSATSPIFAVTINARPTATITSTSTAICNGSNTNITGTVIANGAWILTLSNGATASGTGNGTFSIGVNPAVSTTYSITSLLDANCTSIAADLTGSTIVTVNDPVVITLQPTASQTSCSGNSVSFTVSATGTGLTYQWRKGITPLVNGGNISGATSAILVINPVAVGDAATDYNVVVNGTAPCAAATSNNASLLVNQAVAITTQPVTQTLCSGNTVTFTVAATGSGLSYQWRKNASPLTDGGDISGSNTNSLTITNLTAADAGNYTVVVTGLTPCAPVTSNIAVLTVNTAVVITTQPTDEAVCATLPATFTVVATGSGLTYQWYKGTFPGTPVTNNANISGATTASLHFNQANIANIDDYYVVITGLAPCTAVQSDYAHLAVDQTITITQQPTPQTVCTGSDAMFVVVASAGVDPLLYQWRKGGIDIPGETSDTLKIIGATAADAGNYSVEITGIAGCITSFSSVVALTVNPLSVGGTVNASTAVCNAANTGTLNLTGQTGNVIHWEFSTDGGLNWSPIVNTTTSLTYNNLTVETMYRAVVQSGVCVPDSSAAATISINPIPDAIAAPSSQTICSGATITTIALSGSLGGTTYTWARNNNAAVTGIAASGTGDISGSLTNTTAAPITVTFTITPVLAGCNGTPVTATVVVNPTPVAVATPSSQAVCSGAVINTIVLSSATSGTTYTWTRDNNGSVTGIAASGNGDISVSLTNTTSAPVTVTFTITPGANGCPGAPITATVVVNPTPDAIATPASQTICSGNSITTIALSGSVSGTTYNWTRNNTGTVTGIAASGSGNISGLLTNTTLSPVTVTFSIAPIADGCPGTPITATVVVDPSPDVIATPSSQTICSGDAIAAIVLSSGVPSTNYAWTRNNTGTVTGITASGNGDISGILTNTTTAPVTVTFTITPTAAGCPGTPITATVVVNPTPNAIATPSSQTICSGGAITAIALSGSVSGTTYSWTRNNSGTVTGIAASGSGNISGSLTNTTLSPVTVTFTITPIANGCPGTAITATVLVNPSPDAIATPSNQTICSGDAITTIALSSSVPSTSYNWTRNNTVSVTGIAASGSGNISGSLTNTTNAPLTVTFTITPTANTCPGASITATVVVNPTPNAVATPSSQTVCSGTAVTNIALTGNVASTTFNWTRNNTGTVTGIAASGSGDISGTLVNTTNALITVTFTITPTANGCPGTPVTATVAVKPTPTVSATNNIQTVCSGIAIASSVITNPNSVAGTTFSWTRDNTANLTGIAASGSGSPISGTLTNTTNVQQVTTFIITATADGCSSSTTVVITVNPKPVMTSAATAKICNNSTVSIPLTSTVSSNYTWVAASNANVSGESTTTQSTSTLSNTLVNTSTIAQFTPRQNVVYTVTPTSAPAGCVGNAQTVTVTVNPPYNVSFYEYPTDDNVFTICDGDLVGGGGQNDIDLIEGEYAGGTLLWQYSIGSSAGPWNAMVGPHFNNLVHDTLPPAPSIFSPMGNYYFRILVDGCPSDTLSMVKTSTLTIAAGGPDNTVCQETSPAAITLSGATVGGTASTTVGGTWSITSLSPANGSNIGTLSNTTFRTPAQIPAVTYTPPSNYAGVVTLTLTSNDPDGNGPCGPLTATRTITLMQAPIIANASAMSICSGTSTNINLTSVIPSTYTWTIGTITGGITGASAGAGSVISQVLTNPSNSTAGTVQYIVTPTSINPTTCAAITSTITVTVTPSPAVSLVRSPAAICIGATSTLTATNTGGTNTLVFSGASGTVNAAIPDDNVLGISSAIALAGSGGFTLAATDIVQVTLNITHTYDQDLDIFLVDPSGTKAMLLSSDNGGSGNDYTNTILKTDVANIIGSGGNNTAPFNGTYRPEGTITTAPGAYVGIPNTALLGASIDGNWTIRIFDDAFDDLGTLVNWSLTITRSGGYTSVVNGPASIGAVAYSGLNNTTATAVVTPPSGLNSYTVTTTDVAGCSVTSAAVDVTVNPGPTLTGGSQQATVCAGSTAQINLTGLISSSTSTITYKINGGPTNTVVGVVANASGDASFNTIALTAANNGQTLQITSVSTTNPAPACAQLITQNVTLSVNATPTLTGATLQAAVCPGSSAQINLAGLVANSTATITYTINAGAPQTATGVVANGSGAASFNTIPLVAGNNGQTLQVTGVMITSATPNCSQSFTRNVTLNVNPTPVLSSTLSPSAICSGSSFSYTASSTTPGATFGWTRAAVAGISQSASSGIANVNEVLTNTTAAPVNVTYVYTTTANSCSNAPGQNVVVTVNPTPTLATVSQAIAVCAGTGATINLTGMLPNTTSTISYSVNNLAQPNITGVVADASGNASFTSANLTALNNGQILKITGISVTSNSPTCVKTVSVITLLSVNPLPSLSTAAQAAAVCISGNATINLTGLIPNSTNNTISYSINAVAQPAVAGVNANASGNASFTTSLLTVVNNGQVLTVTGITNGTCSQSFTQNVTLAVSTANLWLGVNTNWFDVQNWCGGIPTSFTDVIIPGSLVNYPLLNSGIGSVRNITIQNTGLVTVSNAKLQIAGTISNSGSFNVVAGTIELNGTAGAQSISGAAFVSRMLSGLIISNPSGVNVSSVANDTLNITDSLAFGNVNNTVLNTGNNITLVSRANKTARVADITNYTANSGNSFTGKVIVERYVPERRAWRLMTVPVQATGAPTFNASWQEAVVNPDYVYANRLDPHPGFGMHISGSSPALGFDPSPNNNPSVKHYDPVTGAWAGIPNTLAAKVTDSAGYMVFVRGDRSTPIYLNTAAPTSNTILRVAGQLKTNNQVNAVPAGVGPYTVVGNPFASAIDFRKISTSGSVSSTNFVMWDPKLTGFSGVGAYQYFTRSGGPGTDYIVFPGNSGPGGGSYGAAFSINNTVQSSQAFMVQNAGAGTVSINEDAKTGGSSSAVFRPASPSSDPAPSVGYLSTLLLYDNNDSAGTRQLVDGALSLYNSDYSDEVNLEDAKKLFNFSSENVGIDNNGTWLQIEKRQQLQSTDTIQYRIRSYRVRDNYQFEIKAGNLNQAAVSAFLEDKYLHTFTALDLNGTSIYPFSVTPDSATWNPTRFRIVFKNMVALPVTFSSVKAYRSSNFINVDWNVAHELSILNYEVEKSADGVHFTKVHIENNVLNGDRSAAYRWVDKDPIKGINYYRIRSKGQDGTYKNSPVVKVMYEKRDGYITLYPNPITGSSLNLYFVNQAAGDYTVRLLSNTGQLIAVKKIKHIETTIAEPFQTEQELLHGNYLIEILRPDGTKQTISVMY
ncbi:MAG: Ig-like domain-containing protein [Chitinophagaceae bacterium]|nr:Ig-like domain-containing protein [Chitinophagaceae bacterium]